MKKYLPLLLIALAAFFGVEEFLPSTSAPADRPEPASRSADSGGGNTAIAQAFARHAHDVPVRGQGTVIKVLADDSHGSRHQRFVLRVAPDQTVLVAHNIDLAPRVFSLEKGDTVAYDGIYEWNDRGGVIHWTHRDPGGRHAGGWLEHGGRRYR